MGTTASHAAAVAMGIIHLTDIAIISQENASPAWETLVDGNAMCVFPDTMATLTMDSVNNATATNMEPETPNVIATPVSVSARKSTQEGLADNARMDLETFRLVVDNVDVITPARKEIFAMQTRGNVIAGPESQASSVTSVYHFTLDSQDEAATAAIATLKDLTEKNAT